MVRPTIADIARRAGVSKGAVSFALNGRSGVSDATRARILEIAEEMQWRPHSAARALGGARAGAIGLVLARPARTLGVEPFFGQLLSGLQGGLSSRSIALQLMIVEDTEAEIEVYRRWSSEHRVDGLVLVDLRIDDPRIAALEELGTPAVVVGGPGPHGNLPSVWADDFEAMTSIVEYLAALGHQRIAHVSGPAFFQHTSRRAESIAAAASRLELEATTVHTDFSDTEGARTTRRLLSRVERPTAIIYDSDVMAVAGLGVASEMGVAVPTELSLASFDDSVLARLTHPSLTALSRDTYEFGRQVALRLLTTIDRDESVDGAASRPERDWQLSTPTLTVRESTGRAPLGNHH